MQTQGKRYKPLSRLYFFQTSRVILLSAFALICGTPCAVNMALEIFASGLVLFLIPHCVHNDRAPFKIQSELVTFFACNIPVAL